MRSARACERPLLAAASQHRAREAAGRREIRRAGPPAEVGEA